ncbi:MAG: type II CRISPR-associated endonuclease Cas1 [Firmicutes bacterium]|nr:type II CRISPR-associated endonuclease Cas1 [Bacillota bacterium]
MTERILDLSEQPARLRVHNGLLVIRRQDDQQETTIPLAELAVVIASHPQLSFTHAVLAGLAEAGASFIACNTKHLPAAMLLPLETHSLQTERFARQAQLPRPRRKRLWQQIVRAKIRAQARTLVARTGTDHGLELLAGRVGSGDPRNCEAQAARIYWPLVFPRKDFRRDTDAAGANRCLNYGYAVLRALTARAICAAGLHPSFGIHHHNRYHPFCLADDLMEPLRPLVDRAVAALWDTLGAEPELDRDTKRALLEPLLARYGIEGESRTLFDWISRLAFSLAAVVEERGEKLAIPEL